MFVGNIVGVVGERVKGLLLPGDDEALASVMSSTAAVLPRVDAQIVLVLRAVAFTAPFRAWRESRRVHECMMFLA